jgi:hypothetical protein
MVERPHQKWWGFLFVHHRFLRPAELEIPLASLGITHIAAREYSASMPAAHRFNKHLTTDIW